MKKEFRWDSVILSIIVLLFSSCSAWEDEMGKDLLPPGDKVFLFHDTIFEIHAYPVSGIPLETSDRTLQSTTLYLLGSLEDTIVGTSKATVFTQFNTTATFQPGPNTEIDSMIFFLYIENFITGNGNEPFTIQLHEATERFYMDSIYYSDYQAEGRYNPVPLAEMTVLPSSQDTVEFLIQDPAFIQKFLDVQTDTALFRNDSIFKDYFNGFYLTAFSQAPEGAMSLVGPSNKVTRLAFRFANDSTEIDTTEGRDFYWATFTINEYYSQKINVFEHDYSNTYLEGIIDRDSVEIPYCYVQGMQGVNTKFTFTGLEEWIDNGPVAINSATLVFDVLPEEFSGITLSALPGRLMVFTELDNGKLENLYDYFTVAQVDDKRFGGILEAESKGMFYDTTYTYRFNIGLHFQAMVDGAKPDYNFRLQLYDTPKNPKISKVWSNLQGNPRRIRLEVVYLKL
jgi:hypothetical protein